MRKFLWAVGIAIGIYLVFRFLLPLVIPFVIAGVVSVIYYPFLRKIYRNSEVWKGRKRKWVLVLSVILFYVVVLVLLGVLCGYLFGQCESIWLNFPFYQARVIAIVKDCCEQVDIFLRMEKGESFACVEGMLGSELMGNLSGVLPRVTSYSVQLAGKVFGFVIEAIITVMATFFLIQDYESLRAKMLESQWGRCVCNMITKCKETLRVYLKAQGCILLMDGILCTLAFFVSKQPYYLVLGPFVAILDALPVLGAGAFLIPYGIYLLVINEFGKALVIAFAYVGCVAIRQLTEPKMIGSELAMRPIFTLLSMYVGYQLFGVIGFLLGPVGVIIGKEIYVLLAEMDYTLANKEQ